MKASVFWFSIIAVSVLTSFELSAQLILNENFPYQSGTQINGQGGWSGSTDILISFDGLSFPGYSSSAIGNGLHLSSQSSGNVSYNLNVAAAPIFIGLLLRVSNVISGENFTLNLFTSETSGQFNEVGLIIASESENLFRLGLGRMSAPGSNVYIPLPYNETIFVVISYDPGLRVYRLYCSPLLGGSIPSHCLNYQHSGSSPGQYEQLRIYSNGTSVAGIIDGIRVSNNWDDIVTLAEPDSQAANLSFENRSTSSLSLSFNPAVGDPQYLILRREGEIVTDEPVDGTFYSAGATVGSSTVAHVGPEFSFTDENLVSSTKYFYAVYTFYQGATTNYNVINPLQGNAFTLAPEPANHPGAFSTLNPGISRIDLAFSSASTISNANGYIILSRLDGNFPATDNITDGIAPGALNLPEGTSLIANITNTSSITYSHLALSPGIRYRYLIIPYNHDAIDESTYNYLTSSSGLKSASAFTLSSEPDAHPQSFVSTTAGSSQIDLTFSAASTIANSSGYIILRRSDGTNPTSAGVVDGVAPASQSLTTGTSLVTVISGTSVSSYNNFALTPNSVYKYAIITFNYNGVNDETYNYLSSGTLATANSVTYAAEPGSQPSNLLFTAFSSTSLNISFTAAESNPDGYLVIRQEGSFAEMGPADGNTYSLGSFAGAEIVHIGSGTSFTDISLTPETHYYYRIYAYNGSGVFTNYLNTSPLEGSRTTLAVEPLGSPSSFVPSAINSSGFTISFTAGNAATGYIALRKTGSSPEDVPADGQSYTVGNIVGSSVVAFAGTDLSFIESNLDPARQYFYNIFSLAGNGAAANYKVNSPLEGNITTHAAEPSGQPSGLIFSNISHSSMHLAFSAAQGTASGYLVVQRAGASPTGTPTDGVSYAAGQSLGDGIIVYVGSATSFDATGLDPDTFYYYDIFAYNGTGITLNYLTNNPLDGSQTTLATEPTAQPTALVFSEFATNSIKLSFAAASGNTSQYIVLRKESSIPTGIPTDEIVYVKGEVIGDSRVIYFGGETSFMDADSDLQAGKVYHYAIYSLNGTGPSTNYLIDTPLSGNAITISDAPIANVPGNITQTTFTISWQEVAGAASYLIDVSLHSNFASLLENYSNKNIDGLTAQINNLATGTMHYYRVRALNASGASANSNIESSLTIPPTPIPTGGSDINPSSFIANWNETLSAEEYFVDAAANNLFTTSLPSYENVSVIGETTLAVTGLEAGTLYYYRVRARNSSGTTPNSSIYDQITRCQAPVADNPSNEFSNSFKANWQLVKGADLYELSVSEVSTFNSTVFLEEIESNEEIITGLKAATKYYYRVRAKNAAGYSAYSNTRQVLTKNADGTVVNPPVVSIGSSSSSSSLIANHSGGDGALILTLKHRPITATVFVSETPISASGSSTAITVSSSWLDALGLEYYFVIEDAAGRKDSSVRAFIYTILNLGQESIQGLSFGGKGENYRIFSIPYTLEDNLVQSIFGVLGDYDKTKWRLIRYSNGKNQDYPTFNRIELGRGYWFNSVNPVDLKIGAGTVPKFNQSNPFRLTLNQGWNQIGCPYPFDIKWSDVLAANPDKLVGNLKVFNPANIGFAESNDLKIWSGGFVFADESTELVFPVTLKNSSGGRYDNMNSITESRLDEETWFVPLTLTHGIGENSTIGFGMHPEAVDSKDRFDDITAPRFLNYLEMHTEHPEFFAPYFGRDVVHTKAQHIWNFTINSNYAQAEATLQWQPEYFGNNTASLYLYDLQAQVLLNMKHSNHYSFDLQEERKLKIMFSIDERNVLPGFTGLGRPYPNPLTAQTTIPLMIEENNTEAYVYIQDMMGKRIKVLARNVFDAGLHQLEWNGEDESGNRVASAVYLLRFESGKSGNVVHKIIVR